MTGQIGAPVFIEGMYITESSFRLSDQPANAMSLNLNVEFERGELRSNEDGSAKTESVTLSVRASLVSQDAPDDERMSVFVCAEGTVGAPAETPLKDDEDVIRYLSTNGASFLYSHIRSYVMTLTGLSPMGAFILPPVLPQAVVERALHGQAEGEGQV